MPASRTSHVGDGQRDHRHAARAARSAGRCLGSFRARAGHLGERAAGGPSDVVRKPRADRDGPPRRRQARPCSGGDDVGARGFDSSLRRGTSLRRPRARQPRVDASRARRRRACGRSARTRRRDSRECAVAADRPRRGAPAAGRAVVVDAGPTRARDKGGAGRGGGSARGRTRVCTAAGTCAGVARTGRRAAVTVAGVTGPRSAAAHVEAQLPAITGNLIDRRKLQRPDLGDTRMQAHLHDRAFFSFGRGEQGLQRRQLVQHVG